MDMAAVRCQGLDNAVDPLRDEETRQAEENQPRGDAPEPGQAALVLLAGNPHVHAPKARDDIHGQHNGAEHGELAQDVVGLLGALVHADVDLREVILVRPRQDPMDVLLVVVRGLYRDGRGY